MRWTRGSDTDHDRGRLQRVVQEAERRTAVDIDPAQLPAGTSVAERPRDVREPR